MQQIFFYVFAIDERLKSCCCCCLLLLTLNGEVNHTVKKVLNYEKLHTVIHRQQQKKIVFTTKVSHYNKLHTFSISSFAHSLFFFVMFFSFTSFQICSVWKHNNEHWILFLHCFYAGEKHVACNIKTTFVRQNE